MANLLFYIEKRLTPTMQDSFVQTDNWREKTIEEK